MTKHFEIIHEIAPEIKNLIDLENKHSNDQVVKELIEAVTNPKDGPSKFMKMIVESIGKEREGKVALEKYIKSLEDLCLSIKRSKFMTDETHALFNQACENSIKRNES